MIIQLFIQLFGRLFSRCRLCPALGDCRRARQSSFKTNLSRRCHLRCGRPLGCAYGPSAGLAAAPSPLSGRFGRSFRRPPLLCAKQTRRAVAACAAAGPSAAPAGPPPALRPPQAPFQGALAAAFAARRFLCAKQAYRAVAACAAAGPSAAPAGPPPALRPPQAPFQGALAAAFAARRFCAQNKPVAPSQPALRPAPRLRLRALRRPCGRPKPPSGCFGRSFSPIAAFCAQNKPVAPGAAYSLSCFSSVLFASGFFSFARSAVAVMPLASPKNTPAFMLPDMLPNTK